MRFFCRHEWEEIARTYAQSMKEQGYEVEDIRGGHQALIALNGQTTIIFKCKKCQEIRKEEMLGKQV